MNEESSSGGQKIELEDEASEVGKENKEEKVDPEDQSKIENNASEEEPDSDDNGVSENEETLEELEEKEAEEEVVFNPNAEPSTWVNPIIATTSVKVEHLPFWNVYMSAILCNNMSNM